MINKFKVGDRVVLRANENLQSYILQKRLQGVLTVTRVEGEFIGGTNE